MATPRVQTIPVPSGGLATGAFPRLDFSDAYAVALPPGTRPDALAAAILVSVPPWVAVLMAVRHVLVAPLGVIATRRSLERAAVAANGTGDRVGVFPVLARSPDEILLGLDDRHLDFRVSVRLLGGAGAPLGVVSTLVRLNGRLGRAYFAVVKPAHRVIVPAMLRRAARRIWSVAPVAAPGTAVRR